MASDVCGAGHPRNRQAECHLDYDHDGSHHDYELNLSWVYSDQNDDRG